MIATNIDGLLAEVIAPLETEERITSDHMSVVARAMLPRLHVFTKKTSI